MIENSRWQREFFALAGTWLACRLYGPGWYGVLGELDYAQEMWLLLKERKVTNVRN